MELFSLFRCKIKLNYFKVVKMGHFDRKIAKIRPKVMEIKVLRQVVFLAPSVFALTVPPNIQRSVFDTFDEKSRVSMQNFEI